MNSDFITVVCGMPRSGTSLMMQMMEAAGFRCAGNYPAYEPEAIAKPSEEFVDSMVGGAFKVIDPHLVALPTGRPYRFMFMTRSRRQQSISLVKLMRITRTIPAGPISEEKMEAMRNALALEESASLATIQLHGCPVLKVRFEDLIERTEPTVWRIADFLGNWNEREMVACVKPRSAIVFNGMLEIDLVAEMDARDSQGEQQSALSKSDIEAERGDREFKIRQEDEA